jgi:hypothetical protein
MILYYRVGELIVFRSKVFYLDDLVGFLLPLAMLLLGKQEFFEVFRMYSFIIMTSSFIFGFVGLNAAHHHPDVTHEGDELRYFLSHF